MPRQYLGDGVYADFDGYQVWCETLVDGRAHRIAFEPETLAALVDFDRQARTPLPLTVEQEPPA